jgi:hypothetical protein
MCHFITPAAEWAATEFSRAELGDRRRTKRLVAIAGKLALNPGGTLPQAMPDWNELKAAYRFFNQGGVTFESILTPHWERTWRACREPGECLLIEDTTDLDYTRHRATQGLGTIGDGGGRGLALHTALAVRLEPWTDGQRPAGVLVGLFGQQCARPRPAPKNELRSERLSRPRKTRKWAAAFQLAGAPPPGCQWTYIADRESDCYEPLHRCQEYGVDFVVRACQDRRLVGAENRLRAAASQGALLGGTTVELRARGAQPARTANVELRVAPVTLDGPWRPGGRTAPLRPIQVVEAREVNPPADVPEPLHWILLTTLPCQQLDQARRVVARYGLRWLIEEYHKALKSGAGVEQSQLAEAHRLEALIAVLAVVAVRLLHTKLLARAQPDQTQAAQDFDPAALRLLEAKLGRPPDGWTNRNLVRALARLGGFLGRKSDGEPGWQTIWRGWHRLMWMTEGLAALNSP